MYSEFFIAFPSTQDYILQSSCISTSYVTEFQPIKTWVEENCITATLGPQICLLDPKYFCSLPIRQLDRGMQLDFQGSSRAQTEPREEDA